MPGEDEPLHAYVTASNPEAVKKAVDKVIFIHLKCQYFLLPLNMYTDKRDHSSRR